MAVRLECRIEFDAATARFEEVADRWGLDEGERGALAASGPSRAGETRMRHVVDIDRNASALLGDVALAATWVRLPNAGLGGLAPVAAMASAEGAVREIRDMLRREAFEAGLDR